MRDSIAPQTPVEHNDIPPVVAHPNAATPVVATPNVAPSRVVKPRVAIADTDSVASDSVAKDTTAVRRGIVLEAPKWEEPALRAESKDMPMSWVVCALMVIFLIVAIRYRSNTKYMRALLTEMYGVRERGNVFDDTVRETSFLVLLNILWVCCGGVLLSALVGYPGALGAAVCAGLMAVYTLLMLMAYIITGNVFTDARHASMWARGFAAGQGVGSLALFPLALLQICYPDASEIWLWCAAGVLIIVKIVFISKGFRIFFTQSASWLLFLYYLCSLEIVPLILAYVATGYVCGYLL